MQVQSSKQEETWVKILKKGIITLPKAMREKAGMKEGDVARAKRIGNVIIIEAREEAPYRVFTDEEIVEWLKKDQLSKKLSSETEKYWSDIP